jgi:hypothetical protein
VILILRILCGDESSDLFCHPLPKPLQDWSNSPFLVEDNFRSPHLMLRADAAGLLHQLERVAERPMAQIVHERGEYGDVGPMGIELILLEATNDLYEGSRRMEDTN